MKVLLFNVWQLPGFLTDGASEARARAAGRLIARSDADVVCLNEAFLRADAVLAEIAATHPHRAELAGRAGSLTPLGSGLRVASRVPLLAAAGAGAGRRGGVFFKSRAGADRFASKGVLHVRLDLRPLLPLPAPPHPSPRPEPLALDLFVTHMQAGASRAEQASRERQAAEAGAFVRARSGGVRPFLLAGDLNMSPCASASPHCATEDDAAGRARAFRELCRRAGVCDKGGGGGGGGGERGGGGGNDDRQRQQQPHEICRFCVGPGVRLLGEVRCLGRRCPDTGALASDTDALLAEVEVEVAVAALAGGGGGGVGG